MRGKLAAHPDMDADGEGFVWVDREARKQLGAGRLHLGAIGSSAAG